MTVEIRLADNFLEEDRRRLYGWGEDIFNLAAYDLEWRPKDQHVFVAVDNLVISHVGLLRHSVRVGGRPVIVGGVGGVVTVPDMHRQGYAQRALRYAESFMCQEMGVEFGLLFCREQLVSFYQRLGWRSVEEPVEFDQPSGKMVSPFTVMVLPCSGQAWPAGTTYLESLPW